jgi:Arc/MetJ-type ribon-helix-helix transcriptional regulator
MTVVLRPEHEEIIREQLAGGQFKSVDEVLTVALSSLPHNRRSNRNAVQRLIQFSKENTSSFLTRKRLNSLSAKAIVIDECFCSRYFHRPQMVFGR